MAISKPKHGGGHRSGGGHRNGGGSKKGKGKRAFHTVRRFPERGGDQWEGPLVDYKEVELLRKFLTTSNKLMSRKRAGTDAREQRALKLAVKRARFIGLVPYTG